MAKFNYGDLRETALPRYIIDAEGNVLGGVAFPMNVTGDVDATINGSVTIDDTWTVTQVHGTEADNDWSVFVPAGQEWQILWLKVKYTSDANAGNRQVVCQVQHAGATLDTDLARAGIVQAASLTRYYLFAPGVADLLAFRDTDYLTTPIPVTTLLLTADELRVYDNNAVSAGDRIDYWLQYAYREV